MKYEIQTFTLCDGWVNTWTHYDENDNEIPSTYDAYSHAQSDLHTYLKDELREYQSGNIESPSDVNDFRIVKTKEIA
jgi:hypothetical protein